jgi:hypothetical protein
MQPAAGGQCVCLGKRFAQYHLVGVVRLHAAAGQQGKAVEYGLAMFRDRHQLSDHRFLEAGDVQRRQLADARFGMLHAGDTGNPRRELFRGARDAGEDIGKPVALVVGNGGLLQ